MKKIISQRMIARKGRLDRRLDKHNYREEFSGPMLDPTNVNCQLAGRGAGTVCGGIGLIQQLVRTLGLATEGGVRTAGDGADCQRILVQEPCLRHGDPLLHRR